jgi:LCP family protein required for cell wall assembly
MAERRPVRRPGPERAARRRLRLAFLILAPILSLAVAAGSVLGFGLLVYADRELGKSRLPEAETADIDTPCDPVCNYLILGSDTRLGLSPEEQALHGDETTVEGERADTIILVHVNPEREQAIVVHFPRDLWVDIPGQGFGKINSAFEGGPNLVVQTVEGLTGIDINHYVGVSLAGFESTVDALGGVRICVDRPMFDQYANLNLESAGCYHMNGVEALAFVRARHVQGDCIPDFSRIARQQQFLRAVIGKLLSPSVLLRLPSLISSTVHNFTVDAGLELPDLISLTNELKGVGTGAVDFRAVPGLPGTEVDANGVQYSVVHMDPSASRLFTRIQEGRPLGTIGKTLERTPISPANVKVRVLNDLSRGKAGRIMSFLEDAGFATLGVSDRIPEGVEGPVVLYRPGAEEQAQAVQRFLPSLPLEEAPEGVLSAADVAVLITSDYEGAGLSATTPSPTAAPGEPSTGCA